MKKYTLGKENEMQYTSITDNWEIKNWELSWDGEGGGVYKYFLHPVFKLRPFESMVRLVLQTELFLTTVVFLKLNVLFLVNLQQLFEEKIRIT